MDTNADLLAHELLGVVPAVMTAIRSEMRSRRGSDLSVMQFRTLVYLNLYPGASLSALAEHLGLTLPTVSQMINSLVRKGMVSRQESPTDRRYVVLSLTSQGNTLLEKSLTGTQSHLSEILSGLAAEEMGSVHQVMLLLEQLFCQPQPSELHRKLQQP